MIMANQIPPIDLVIPYVTNQDEVWRKTYREYCEKHGLKARLRESDSVRFRDCSFLQYLLRSVETNVPWINRIFLIVSNIEQVPLYVDKQHISVILHKDIIPAEYLPVFNSEAIEMFLGNIPGLSEHFIYGNDDFLFLNKCEPEDFFDFGEEEKIKVKVYKFKADKKDPFTETCKNVVRYAKDLTKWQGDEKGWLRPEHDFTPMLLSQVKKCQELLKDYPTHFVPHAFRTSGDYNQYIYTMCMYYWGFVIDSPRDYCYIDLKDKNLYNIASKIENSKVQTITLNDTGPNIFNIKYINILNKSLKKKFPNKSIYEKIDITN